jgi:ABC-type glycerol-3-phosphate transport system substrate-binding protein
MYRGAHLRQVLTGCLLLGVVALALTGCAADTRLTRMTPFTRGVLLIYDGDGSHSARKNVAEALLYLELETGKPRTVTVRAFDDHDRPMNLDPELIVWSTGINAKIVPEQGNATVQVTLLGGDSGDLMVAAANHTGQLKIRKKAR